MARINIEDKMFNDPRFKALERSLPQFVAEGVMVRLFQLAQIYWCEYSSETKRCLRSAIPKEIFALSNFPQEVFKFGIVKEVDSGFYVVGSEEHFAWLVQKKESGSRGGSSNKDNNLNKAVLKRKQAVLKPRLSGGNPPTLTPTLTLTPSLSIKESKGENCEFEISKTDLKNSAIAERQKTPKDSKIGYFIACYLKAFQNRYNARPDLSGKRLGQIKTLVKGCENFEELCDLIQVYCQSNDPWFCKKMHDIQTFAENIGKVRVLMKNGVDSTAYQEQKGKENFWEQMDLS